MQWKRGRFAEEQLYMNGIHLDVSPLGLFWETWSGINIPRIQFLDTPITGKKATHGDLLPSNFFTFMFQFNPEYHYMQINILNLQTKVNWSSYPPNKGNTLFYNRESAFGNVVLITPPEYLLQGKWEIQSPKTWQVLSMLLL